jgi:hypothetical protein
MCGQRVPKCEFPLLRNDMRNKADAARREGFDVCSLHDHVTQSQRSAISPNRQNTNTNAICLKSKKN